jgi:hypothetical protein
MKRRSRITRALKWAGTVCAVMLIVLWAASVRYSIGAVRSSSVYVFVESGAVRAEWWTSYRWFVPIFEPSLLGIGGDAWGWRCKPRLDGPNLIEETLPSLRRTTGCWAINGKPHAVTRLLVLPLWILLALVAGPTLLFWRIDRRIAPGHCECCGYNLTGNVSGICPECGTPVKRQGGPA